MILFLTTRGHQYTVHSLVHREFGAELPDVQVVDYDQLFRAEFTRSATHIFTDIERLYPWELRLAAELYRSLGEIGVRRLNDPARVKTRYQLLRALHNAGLNPFDAYRAEDRPRPKRFPVFLKQESEHFAPLSPLIGSQEELDAFIEALPNKGTPLCGVIVIEYCAEPVAPGVWQKFGTYSINGEIHVDHSIVEDSWAVKGGKPGLATEAKFLDEKDAIITNRYAEIIRPVFLIANIEYGRADHGKVAGREVVYEINTNPTVGHLRQQRSPIRDEAFKVGHQRMGRLLWNIDSGDGSEIRIPRTEQLDDYRRRNSLAWSPQRP